MTTTVLDQNSGKRMAATVAALAGDAFAGRRVGSNGGAAARRWPAEHLATAGATVSFKAFPVSGVPEVYSQPTLTWSNGTVERRLAFGREFAVHLSLADRSKRQRGGLVVVGRGDPAGRWVVVLRLGSGPGWPATTARPTLRNGSTQARSSRSPGSWSPPS